MTAVGHGWEDHFDPGERLLWQGEPAAGYHVRDHKAAALGVTLIVVGLMALDLRTFINNGQNGFDVRLIVLAVGMVSCLVGFFIAFDQIIWRPQVLKKTRYALSNRHAFMTQRLAGRSIVSLRLSTSGPVSLEPTNPPTIKFLGDDLASVDTMPIRFEFIEDADHVIKLLRSLGIPS